MGSSNLLSFFSVKSFNTLRGFSTGMKRIVLLRLGHRPERDKRITTHVGLTARLLGAEGMLLASNDPGIVKTLEDVVRRWGGDFYIRNNVNFKQEIKEWKAAGGKVCHLSKSCDRLMIVVGAEKVPPEIYQLADWNVAVGSQPHSEVAAVAITMDRIADDEPLEREFPNAELTIMPAEKGKQVIENIRD
jgi:tRNA (cytidine56-2'-O)-methyltransferase